MMNFFDRTHVTALFVFALASACGSPPLTFDAATPHDGAVDVHTVDAPDATTDVPRADVVSDVARDASDAATDASDAGDTGARPDAADASDALDVADAPMDAPSDVVDVVDAADVVDIVDVASDVSVIPVHLSPLALSRGNPSGPGGLDTSSCALRDDGTVRCWGSHLLGQLGDGSGADQSTPVIVSGLTNVVELAGGYTDYCARLADGTVRCWGSNTSGQIGNGTTVTLQPTPVEVTGLRNAIGLAVGSDHACAVIAGGTVECWGANEGGELGATGPDTCSEIFPYNCARTPVAVAGLTGVVEIDASTSFTCARLVDGSVKCWGYANDGVIGIVGPDHCSIGTSAFRCALTPQDIPAAHGAVEIVTGQDHTCARMGDGTVLCTGRDDYGQLGDGGSFGRTGFAPVIGLTGAVSLTTGANHLCVRLADASVQCWGDNTYGQIPSDPETCHDRYGAAFPCHLTPAAVHVFDGYPEVMPGLNQTCARDPAGATFCVGGNSHGQLGDGTIIDRAAPVAVVGMP